MIDQQCESAGNSHAALELVLREWSALRVPVHHLVGNHELYNFNRAECQELIPNITPWYRSFKPVDGWRVVVLDPYELNMIERGGGVVVDAGLEFLSARNPNYLKAPRGTVDVSKGMVGQRRRFLQMGGALGNEQLLWLRDVLLTAREAGERIIILSHLPFLPESTVPGALLWNFEGTLGVIREFGGTVALVPTGHFHAGGYAVDETGTHHLTLPSPLHAELSDPRAHCTVEVMEDRIDIVGDPCKINSLHTLDREEGEDTFQHHTNPIRVFLSARNPRSLREFRRMLPGIRQYATTAIPQPPPLCW